MDALPTHPQAEPGEAPRASVEEIRSRPTAQVLVIGGGINGIATFRDLALQGVDVVLVERGDYVSGASSASSHMVHGGIRYLENGEFRLVNESVHERNGLLKIAPHYVKPLQTTMPIFTTFSAILSAPLRMLTHKQGKPKQRGAALIKVGMTIYDTFSRDGGTVPKHRFLTKKAALKDLPELNKDFKYTATYYDASMHDPERIALDVLTDGIAVGANARATNYVEAVGMTAEGVTVRDTLTGETFSIAAPVVLNTSGPWTDLTNADLGLATQYMGGTKGSHIVLDNDRLLRATKGRELFFEHDDGRIVLIYPLKGKVMVGTTDIDADPAKPVVCTDEEVDYFFELVQHVFPDIPVDRSQIVYRFSGIRPLPKHDDTQPGFVSRDYRIVDSTIPSGTLLSLVGGKWTTFRALAETLTDKALALLSTPRTVSTVGLAIGGGKGFPTTVTDRRAWIAANAGDLPAERAAELLDRYGTKAVGVIAALPADDAPLAYAADYTRGEIAHIARDEQVVHLVDVVKRRTHLAFTGSLSGELVRELAETVGDELGWSAARRDAEVHALVVELAERHGVELEEVAALRG